MAGKKRNTGQKKTSTLSDAGPEGAPVRDVPALNGKRLCILNLWKLFHFSGHSFFEGRDDAGMKGLVESVKCSGDQPALVHRNPTLYDGNKSGKTVFTGCEYKF